jgi:predicted nucleic acid-binding protein
MGTLTSLLGKRAYLDANVFIYAANGFAPFSRVLKEVFDAVDGDKMTAITSELTVAEILVTPFRNADARQETECRRIVAPRPGFGLIEIKAEILEKAARLRAANRALRLPDAIHLATAILSKCDVVLTNDQHLKAAKQIPVILLADAVQG